MNTDNCDSNITSFPKGIYLINENDAKIDQNHQGTILLDKKNDPCPYCGSRKTRFILKGQYTQLSKSKQCIECRATWKQQCSKFSALLFLFLGLLMIIGFSIPYIEWLNFKTKNVPWLRAWPNDARGSNCLPYFLIPAIGIGIWVLILSVGELIKKR